jgi:hypothetical protein
MKLHVQSESCKLLNFQNLDAVQLQNFTENTTERHADEPPSPPSGPPGVNCVWQDGRLPSSEWLTWFLWLPPSQCRGLNGLQLREWKGAFQRCLTKAHCSMHNNRAHVLYSITLHVLCSIALHVLCSITLHVLCSITLHVLYSRTGICCNLRDKTLCGWPAAALHPATVDYTRGRDSLPITC